MNPEEPNNKVSSLEEAKKRKQPWRRIVQSNWFIPAVYLTLIALLIGTAFWLQGEKDEPTMKPTSRDTVLPVEEPKSNDKFISPVSVDSEAVVTTDFYQESASSKQKESALVKYANTYWPHLGIDYARKDKKSFSVVAAMDGKVIRVDQNPILGEFVEIQHDNGLVTVYQSLEDVKVKQGQEVKQGDPIAQAGENQFEKEQGKHLHFEIRKNEQAVNPNEYFSKE